jgi:hypothetical protein
LSHEGSAKVREQELAAFSKQHILWFDVAMDKTLPCAQCAACSIVHDQEGRLIFSLIWRNAKPAEQSSFALQDEDSVLSKTTLESLDQNVTCLTALADTGIISTLPCIHTFCVFDSPCSRAKLDAIRRSSVSV